MPVAIGAMHFVLYSWLYRTQAYILISVTIAIGGMLPMLVGNVGLSESGRAARVCLFTGLVMYATSAALTLT